jgi:hypothetical protein
MDGLAIDGRGPGCLAAVAKAAAGLTAKNAQGKRNRHLRGLEDPRDLEFVRSFDWEGDLMEYKASKSVNINPISALFGQLINCNGMTINFNGPVHYKG